MWKPSFTTTQLQFLASLNTKVNILPNFSDSEIYLMSTRVGPFKANLQTTVPLWLALQLKSRQKCKIIPPFWFDVQIINEFIEKERRNTNDLTNLQNEEFFEISYLFMSRAPDDVARIVEMRGLIEGLENIRKEKIRRIFDEARGTVKLVNLTTFQANRVREPLSRLSMMVDRLKKGEREKEK